MEKEILTKAYLVQISGGTSIQIDEDELPKVIYAIQNGKVAMVKQGVINPSYVTCVVEDKKRVELWLEDTKYRASERNTIGMQPLKELINMQDILKKIPGGNSLPAGLLE